MRHSFGGDISSWAFTVADTVIAPSPSTTVTFWSAKTSGTQYTDLAGAVDGSSPTTSITTSSGADGSAPGSIPQFWGPDGITYMWAQVASLPRQLIVATNAFDSPKIGHILPFSVGGTLTVAAGKHRIYNDTGAPLTIRAVRASVNTAPTGAAIRVDVNRNGTTIFTTQANRPNIAVSTNTSKVTNMDVTSLADGDYMTVDVDVIGSTVAGADLTVQILCS